MIDLDQPADRIRKVLQDSVHSSLPAFRGSADNIVGVVQGKDLLKAYLAGAQPDARDFVRPALVVPATLDALDLIEQLKASALRMALVHDEYGHFLGIVTAADILEAITGAFRSDEGPPQPKAVRRAEGEWLIDADLPADEMADLLGIGLASRGFSTTAGFVLAALGRLPEVGEHVTVQGWRFEVVDLDGRRIDKVLAQRVPAGRRAR
jgi:putative hemolysin